MDCVKQRGYASPWRDLAGSTPTNYPTRRTSGFVSENSLQVDGQRRKYYIVEQDYYFVLGDSPDMSRDSRHWGLVPEKNLVGKVLGIIWPLRVGDNLS